MTDMVPTSQTTKVVMLGSGTPTPDPRRSGPSVAVVVDDTPYLFDAGPGVVRRAQAATPQYGGTVAGLEARKLRKLFLTHLHTDHTIGIPDVMFTPWSQGASHPLEIYGPTGTIELCSLIQRAWQADRDIRLHGLEPVSDDGCGVDASDFTGSGRVYEDDNVVVDAIEVHHGSWPLAVGYRVETPDRVVVISGDNSQPDLLLEAASGADILVHECYGLEGFGSIYEQSFDHWAIYHRSFHTSTDDLAAMATKAQPGLLVLYHELLWSDDREANAREIRRSYDGAVVSSHDLDVY